MGNRDILKMEGKFEAYCYTRRCGQSLMKNGKTHLPTAITGKFADDKNIEKLDKEIIDRNTKAIALLVVALTTSTCRVLVHTSKVSNLD